MEGNDTPNETKSELVIYDFDPRNLPPEYLQAVGLVAMASAQTESVLQNFIGVIFRTDIIETLALTTHMAMPLKDHVIRAGVELNAATSNFVDDVDDLLDAINEAMAKRNMLVHNPLITHPETREIFSHRLKARGSLQLELKPISVEEIQTDAELIYKVGMDLMDFMMRHGLGPTNREHLLREPLDRSKKARAARRSEFVAPHAGSEAKPAASQ